MSDGTRGTRTLLLFGLVTLLSGLELCGQRVVDLYALSPATTLDEKELLSAAPLQRVRFDPAHVRFDGALWYRRDLHTFSEQDPRVTVIARGPTELAALAARRRELHGMHLMLEDVAPDPPAFLGPHDTRPESMRGLAAIDRVYAALGGSGDQLWVGAPVVGPPERAGDALLPRRRFEGTLAALAEEAEFDQLSQSLRVARPTLDPESAFVVLEGQAAAPTDAAIRLLPLGPSYNLFVAAPDGVDLTNTPAEGTMAEPIERPDARGSLRRMIIAVRKGTQQSSPIRIIFPGDARSFRESSWAPARLHPGGGILLGLGLVCSVLGFVLGARRDRSGTEEKLWFEGVVGAIELLAVVVPAAWFLLQRRDLPPAPPIGSTGVAQIVPAAVAPVSTDVPPAMQLGENAADLTDAKAILDEIRGAKNATALGTQSTRIATVCARIEAAKVPSADARDLCRRERPRAELLAALTLLQGKPPRADKKSLCDLAGRASRLLVEQKLDTDTDIRENIAKLGRACL